MVDKLFELIEGVTITTNYNSATGAIKYYKRAPDLQAIVYALDRVLGKPKQVSVQASFSLAKLIIESSKVNGNNRSDDNEEVPAKSSLLHREDLVFEAPAFEGGV